MKLFMGNLSAADALHYYTYTQNENVITQTCVYHSSLAATATVTLEENLRVAYTGDPVEPMEVVCSADWEYDLPNVTYENNVHGGVATSSVVIGDAKVDGTFTIIEAPTILGGSVRLSTPAGLRFQSKVPQAMVEMGGTFGTLVPHPTPYPAWVQDIGRIL